MVFFFFFFSWNKKKNSNNHNGNASFFCGLKSHAECLCSSQKLIKTEEKWTYFDIDTSLESNQVIACNNNNASKNHREKCQAHFGPSPMCVCNVYVLKRVHTHEQQSCVEWNCAILLSHKTTNYIAVNKFSLCVCVCSFFFCCCLGDVVVSSNKYI